jgi:hypothetical protein
MNKMISSDVIPSWDGCLPEMETSSGPLVTRCHAVGDRTGHSVWWRESETDMILLSLEGTSDQAWPCSPPLQEIVAENVAAGKRPALLGVGMAGKAHWSATIEGDAFTEAIAFDIACRTATVPALLGSAYLIGEAWTASQSDQSLILEHQDGRSVVLESIGSCGLAWSGRNVALKPLFDVDEHQRGKTYRWRYFLRKG